MLAAIRLTILPLRSHTMLARALFLLARSTIQPVAVVAIYAMGAPIFFAILPNCFRAIITRAPLLLALTVLISAGQVEAVVAICAVVGTMRIAIHPLGSRAIIAFALLVLTYSIVFGAGLRRLSLASFARSPRRACRFVLHGREVTLRAILALPVACGAGEGLHSLAGAARCPRCASCLLACNRPLIVGACLAHFTTQVVAGVAICAMLVAMCRAILPLCSRTMPAHT